MTTRTAPLPDDTEAAIRAILSGTVDDAAAGAFLTTLAERGETGADVAAAARTMRALMRTVKAPPRAIDVCGTGGDGSHSLNVSTAVAFVVAACGVPVAKHGNRAATSQAGAADTLAALGIDLEQAAASAEADLADMGIAFLFAPLFHPALGRIAPLRKSLGRRTVFNLTGPLANPAQVRRQLVGVARPDLIPVMADALAALGTERAAVVSGDEGLDEISVAGPTSITWITRDDDGFVTSHDARVAPEDAGLSRHAPDALRGGDAAYNAAALERLLDGERGAYRDAVVLNSAAALMVDDPALDWIAAAEEAAEAIDKGLARALLNCWRAQQAAQKSPSTNGPTP